jgi:NADH pyrophosphatase NudC (nudix superfamily)
LSAPGRSGHFPPGIYSVLAGFVEPGESAEEAVVREVYEETRIVVDNVRYFGSQPWPFPNSLMFGFTVQYVSGEIDTQFDDEVEDADGFEQAFVSYCERIAEVAPLAATQTKRMVTRIGLPDDLETHLRDELACTTRGLRSEDGREAVRAILQKRKPVFAGR